MDPSTLNRNLQPLSRRRLVSRWTSRDGRRKLLALTDKGKQAVAEASPLWEKAQSQFVGQIGNERWEELLSGMQTVVESARLS
jgi:DNA-binding MarR family transcriptional regulator